MPTSMFVARIPLLCDDRISQGESVVLAVEQALTGLRSLKFYCQKGPMSERFGEPATELGNAVRTVGLLIHDANRSVGSYSEELLKLLALSGWPDAWQSLRDCWTLVLRSLTRAPNGSLKLIDDNGRVLHESEALRPGVWHSLESVAFEMSSWKPPFDQLGDKVRRLEEPIYASVEQLRANLLGVRSAMETITVQGINDLATTETTARSIETRAKLQVSEANPEPSVQKRPTWNENNRRDEWLYQQYATGRKWAEIVQEFKVLAKENRWEEIDTEPGLRSAADRYAKREGLPDVPRRTRGPKKLARERESIKR